MFEHTGVLYIDCQRPNVPNTDDEGGNGGTRTHNGNAAENLPHSPGTLDGGCRSDHTTDWALGQISGGKIHEEEESCDGHRRGTPGRGGWMSSPPLVHGPPGWRLVALTWIPPTDRIRRMPWARP